MRIRILGQTGRGSAILIAVVLLIGVGLAGWKVAGARAAAIAAYHQPEPVEAVTTAVAEEQQHRATTTSIGAVLVALDVSVEQADLRGQQAQAALTLTSLARLERLRGAGGASEEEVDRARAERDIAQAQIARTEAIIAEKTIRAPFRARVGITDVHPGQYLTEGTQLTTLQGVEGAAHVDFTVSQQVGAQLRLGQQIGVLVGEATPIAGRIVAVDSRVDPATRTTMVRATIAGSSVPAPGSSVRVLVPAGAMIDAVVIPVSAVRRGPGGDHVFVIALDSVGKLRAHERPVRAGPVLDDEIVILDGLKAGEQVAASGSFKLRESVLVAPAAPVAPAVPKGAQ